MTKFEFKKITRNDPLFNDILALRYQVYCEQRGFEKPEDHPDGLERDPSDDHAVHFAAIIKETKEVVGTIRIILKSSDGFPVENHFQFDKDNSHIDKECIAEVSRLAVNNEACREWWRNETGKRKLRTQPRDTQDVDLITGLIRCIAIESRNLGITHWYAVMARALFVILKRKKVVFTRFGPEIDYHGMRAPYFGEVKNILMGNNELSNAFVGDCATAAA